MTAERVKKEPAADIRQLADAVRQMFVAFVDEGFTETQALALTGSFVMTYVRNGGAE